MFGHAKLLNQPCHGDKRGSEGLALTFLNAEAGLYSFIESHMEQIVSQGKIVRTPVDGHSCL